jgi:hypothetical protein
MPSRIRLSKEAIRQALQQTGGNRSAAAHLLNVSPQTLARRINEQPALFGQSADSRAIREADDRERIYTKALKGNLPTQKKVLAAAHAAAWGGLPEPVRQMTPEEAAEFLYNLQGKPVKLVNPAFRGRPPQAR